MDKPALGVLIPVLAVAALLRGELLETQERLDFTERMITSRRKEA